MGAFGSLREAWGDAGRGAARHPDARRRLDDLHGYLTTAEGLTRRKVELKVVAPIRLWSIPSTCWQQRDLKPGSPAPTPAGGERALATRTRTGRVSPRATASCSSLTSMSPPQFAWGRCGTTIELAGDTMKAWRAGLARPTRNENGAGLRPATQTRPGQRTKYGVFRFIRVSCPAVGRLTTRLSWRARRQTRG